MSQTIVRSELRESATQNVHEQELHLLDVLIVLSKRRKFILRFTLAVTILAMIGVLVMPSRYTAETIIMPPSQNSSSSSAFLNQVGTSSSTLASLAGGSLGIKNPTEMYVALFLTEPVENALIQRFDLATRYRQKKISDARKAFENEAKVALGNKDGLIRITVTDKDPKMAAEIANGYVDEFRKLSQHLAITEAGQRRMFFEKELRGANENLVNAEESMKNTEQTTGVLQIDSQARALIEAAETLRAQIGAKEVELEAMHAYATDDNPQVVLARHELDALRTQFAQLTGKSADSSSDIIVPKGDIPAAQIAYLRSMRDVQYYQTVKEILAKEFEMAKLDEAREGAIIQVVQPAIPPDKRSSPKRTFTILVALVISFFVACGWCVVREVVERLKNNPAERQRIEALRAAYRKR